MSEIKISTICEATYNLGEGPHWSEEDQTLVFVDVLSGNIHRYFPQTQRIQSAHIEDEGKGSSVSFIIPVEDARDTFVISLGTSLALIKWSPTEPDNQVMKSVHLLTLDETHPRKVQFNDAKCDNKGRLYTGTMEKEYEGKHEEYFGSLFSIDSDVNISKLVTNIRISNGLAFSRDNKTFYYIDSMEYSVDAFDYSLETGNISNRRSVFDYKSHPEVKGFPDGMSIDENDNLWVANFNGYQLININPREGKVLRVLDMPAQNITSCCWGGPDYSTLFVTSAKLFCEDDDGAYPDNGKTFAVTGLGVRGLPPKKFKMNNITKFLESKREM